MCVAPILPQPPATGRNTSGASAMSDCCSSVESIRFPNPRCSWARVAKMRPPKRKSAAPMWALSSASSKPRASSRKSFASMKLPFWQGHRLPQPTVSRLTPLHRRQHIRIAGQEPAAVGLFAVDRGTITGESTLLSAGERGHGYRVPAPRIGNLADDHDLLQLANAADPKPLVSGRELGGEPIRAE